MGRHESEKVCKNCGVRITKVNFALGESWMHHPAGSAFKDGEYRFCKVTEAEPLEVTEEYAVKDVELLTEVLEGLTKS